MDDQAGRLVGDRPLRVCHLAKFYPPATGGIETHLQTLAQAQVRLGASVRVLCVNHLDRSGQDVTWQSLAYTPSVEERDGQVEVFRVGRRASLFRLELSPSLLRLGKHLRQWRADVLHLHVPNPTMLLPLVVHGRQIPLAISYHSDVVKQKLLGVLQRPFETSVFRRARAVIAASPAYAEASETLQRYSDRVRVIQYGLDIQEFINPNPVALAYAEQLRQRYPGPLWLSVGRLVYYKGLSVAVEALRHVAGRLLIIGEGPLRSALEQAAQAMGLADRVVFLGRVSNDERCGAYQAATALWFPSNARSEAFGLVQVEAMASGCPVVNADIPGSGVSWVSRHGESGLTVPVSDAEALAAAGRQLLGDGELRQRLADGARKRARREFDSHTMALRTLDVYRGIVSGRKTLPREATQGENQLVERNVLTSNSQTGS